MEPLVIIGYGGLAREIAKYVEDINNVKHRWDFLGYCGEDQNNLGTRIGKYKIIMDDSSLVAKNESISVAIGSGFPKLIDKIHEKTSHNDNLLYPNIVHPTAYVGSEITLNNGIVLCPGAVISVDTFIGKHNVFNWNCTVGHDAIIGDYCVFNPSCNISGSTKIGSRVLVGTGAQVLQGLSICDDVVIGAGAVVTKDITEPGVYVGMPAHRIK